MKFTDLAAKYRTGTLTASDLEGVSAADSLKLRTEGDGVLACAFDIDALQLDAMLAKGDEGEDAGKRKLVPYVMVSDGLIPPFNDRIVPNAWDIREFRQRGSLLLYDHNFETSRPPVGRMQNVKKGQEIKRHGKQYKALVGDADFMPAGTFQLADLLYDLVSGGWMPGGSVGFYIDKARPATDEEQEELGQKPHSLTIEKARLEEFSIVALGRDPNALVLSRSGEKETLAGRLERFAREGVYDADVVGALRQDVLSRWGQPTRVSVPVPELPEGQRCDPTLTSEDHAQAVSLGLFDGNGQQIAPPVSAGTFGICTPTHQGEAFIPLPLGTHIPLQFGNDSAVEKLERRVAELETQLAALRAEGAEREQSAAGDYYDELLELAETAPAKAAPHTEEQDGDAGSEDLFDVAIALGYSPAAE